MMAEATTIEIRIFPYRNSYSVLWPIEAFVYGNWAAHKDIKSVLSEKDEEIQAEAGDWVITHIPSGAVGFFADELEDAIEGARRLSLIHQPLVEIVDKGEERPKIGPLPLEWVREASVALTGLNIYGLSGNGMGGRQLVPAKNLYKHCKSVRKKRGVQ